MQKSKLQVKSQNWSTKKLGEVATIRMGETLIKKDLTNDGMPVYSADSTEIPWGFTSHNKLRFNHGSLVVGARGTIGSIKLPKDNFFTATQTTIVITPDSTIFPKFLYFVLQFQDFRDITSGVGIPMITVRSLWNLEIPLPPIAEQKRIVKKIEKLFAKIDEASRLCAESSAASAALLPSALHQVFNSKIKSQKSKLQFKIKNWPTKKLGEICDFKNGLWKGKKQLFKKVKVLRNTNFRNGGYLDLGNIAEIEVEKKQLAERLLQKGDLILERSGGGPTQPVGRAVYFDAAGEFSFSNFTTRIRIKNPKELYNKYLWRYLNNLYISGATEKMQKQTTGIRNLNFSEYKELKIPLPPITEQKKIVAYLDALSAKTRELQNLQKETAADFSALRQSVLAKVFKQL